MDCASWMNGLPRNLKSNNVDSSHSIVTTVIDHHNASAFSFVFFLSSSTQQSSSFRVALASRVGGPVSSTSTQKDDAFFLFVFASSESSRRPTTRVVHDNDDHGNGCILSDNDGFLVTTTALFGRRLVAIPSVSLGDCSSSRRVGWSPHVASAQWCRQVLEGSGARRCHVEAAGSCLWQGRGRQRKRNAGKSLIKSRFSVLTHSFACILLVSFLGGSGKTMEEETHHHHPLSCHRFRQPRGRKSITTLLWWESTTQRWQQRGKRPLVAAVEGIPRRLATAGFAFSWPPTRAMSYRNRCGYPAAYGGRIPRTGSKCRWKRCRVATMLVSRETTTSSSSSRRHHPLAAVAVGVAGIASKRPQRLLLQETTTTTSKTKIL